MTEDTILTKNIFNGIITKIYGTVYQVEIIPEKNQNLIKEETLYCTILGKLELLQEVHDEKNPLMKERLKLLKTMNTRHPFAVGDMVKVMKSSNSDGNTKDESEKTKGQILELTDRKNKLSRTFVEPHGHIKEHVIATNVDYVIIVSASKKPKLKTGLIDRILLSCEKEGIEPIIVINKIDLDKKGKSIEKIREMYNPIGYKTVFVSASTNEGIDELKDLIKNKTVIFTGHSGVGKSSITNAILGSNKLKVTETSNYHNKGRHTTTNAELIKTNNGGYVIDTPGTKLFGIYNVDENDFQFYFKEFAPYINKCKYSPCSHSHEPDCAVKDAVENGDIHPERYKNYLYIMSNPS